MQGKSMSVRTHAISIRAVFYSLVFIAFGIPLAAQADGLPRTEIERQLREQLGSTYEIQEWSESLVKRTIQGPVTIDQLSVTIKAKLTEPLYLGTGRHQNGKAVLEMTREQGSIVDHQATVIVADSGGLVKTSVQVVIGPPPQGPIGNPLSLFPTSGYTIGHTNAATSPAVSAPTGSPASASVPGANGAPDPLQQLIALHNEQGEIWGRETYGNYEGSPVILRDLNQVDAYTLEGIIDRPYQLLSNPFTLVGVAPEWTLTIKTANPPASGTSQMIYALSLEAETFVARRGPIIALSVVQSTSIQDRFARESAPWDFDGDISDYAQLGGMLINLNTLEMVSDGWSNQPLARVKNMPGRFWPVNTNYSLSVQPLGAYLASDVHTEDRKRVSLNPLAHLDGQVWVAADLSRYVRLHDGDLWAGTLDWQNNSASAPRNLTNIGLLNNLTPISWFGNHFYFYNAQSTDKPMLRIDTDSGEILELAQSKALNLHSQGSPDGRFLFASDGGQMTYSAAGEESLVHVFDALKNTSFTLDATLDRRIYIGTQKQAPVGWNIRAGVWPGRTLFRAYTTADTAWFDLENRQRIVPGQFPDLVKALPYNISIYSNQFTEIPGGRFLDIVYDGFMQPPDGQSQTLKKRFRVDREQRSAVQLPMEADIRHDPLMITWVDENRYVYPRRKGSLSEVGTWLYDIRSGQQTRLTPFFQDERLYADNHAFTGPEQTIWTDPLYITGLYLVLPDKNRVVFSVTRGDTQELVSVSLDGGDLLRKPMPRSTKGSGQARLRRLHPYEVTLPSTLRTLSRSDTVVEASSVSSETTGLAPSSEGLVKNAEQDEADSVKQWCYSKKDIRNEIDCECLAEKYLLKRRELGPDIGRDIVLGSLNGQCKNLERQQEVQYAHCMAPGAIPDTGGIERETFCNCYADKWVERFAALPGKFDPRLKVKFGSYALGYCARPSSYE
ncbi:MAG: hypothetical protein COA75_08390 [Cellvibrionales bacterium]|nr:MAG: hypothetical protein COA75_08390 [Cellvibrionales bacterium]